MPLALDPHLRRALAERVRFYNELGIYDFYQREPRVLEAAEYASATVNVASSSESQLEVREEMSARKSAAVPTVAGENAFEILQAKAEYGVADPVEGLKLIREDLGDCTRCKLHLQGRKQIVFGVGN